jgi:hypothetical protein
VQELPADAPRAAAAIAMNPMADALNAAEALHIDVQEIAGMGPHTDGRASIQCDCRVCRHSKSPGLLWAKGGPDSADVVW